MTCVTRAKDYRLSIPVFSDVEIPYIFITVDTDADHSLMGFKVQYQDPRFTFQISDGQGYNLSNIPVHARQYQTGWGAVGSTPGYLNQSCIVGAGQFAKALYPALAIPAGGQIRVALTTPGPFNTSMVKFIFHTNKRFFTK